MNKKDLKSRFGKDRCQDMYKYLTRLNGLYNFPYSEDNLTDFIMSLTDFSKIDLFDSFRVLEKRKFYGPLKFNDIKDACSEAKKIRIRIESINQIQETTKSCPMPEHIKKQLSKSLNAKIG